MPYIFKNTDGVAIHEPIMRGAAIDWKATAHHIADQLWSERRRFDDNRERLEAARRTWWWKAFASAEFKRPIGR